jgi:integrase
LESGTLQVRATLQNMGNSFAFAEPKTAHSRRRIALPQTAIEALKRHRLRQRDERDRLGAAWQDMDLVFPNSLGKPMGATNLLAQNFHPLLTKARLPRMRFHDLRHTAATLLLGRGINPKIVSEMLGHSQVGITETGQKAPGFIRGMNGPMVDKQMVYMTILKQSFVAGRRGGCQHAHPGV